MDHARLSMNGSQHRGGAVRSRLQPRLPKGGSSSNPPGRGDPNCYGALAGLIETAIVPRLVAGHDGQMTAKTQARREVASFTAALLAEDSDASRLFFEKLVTGGLPLGTLFDELLVAAARRLGEQWESDEIDFVDVARAMDHIHQIVLANADPDAGDLTRARPQRRILLAALPDERHRLGLCLVRAELWREGWEVCCIELQSLDELPALVKTARYHAVGISAGRVPDVTALERVIARTRKASLRRPLKVIAGGYAFTANPTLGEAVGVDATADSAHGAAVVLRELVSAEPETSSA